MHYRQAPSIRYYYLEGDVPGKICKDTLVKTCNDICHGLMPLTILQVELIEKSTLKKEEKKRNKIDRVETSNIDMRQLPMSHVTERSRGPRDPPSDVK